MEAKWKQINSYQDYEVNNFGEVRNKKTNKILKPRNTGKGYMIVTLYKNGIPKHKKVHRLVAEAFLGYSDLHIDHIDMNRGNNVVTNLRYCTPRQNKVYGIDKSKTTSRYNGVTRRKNKWVSLCTINGKAKYLGMYNCEFAAHVAYVNATRKA